MLKRIQFLPLLEKLVEFDFYFYLTLALMQIFGSIHSVLFNNTLVSHKLYVERGDSDPLKKGKRGGLRDPIERGIRGA